MFREIIGYRLSSGTNFHGDHPLVIDLGEKAAMITVLFRLQDPDVGNIKRDNVHSPPTLLDSSSLLGTTLKSSLLFERLRHRRPYPKFGSQPSPTLIGFCFYPGSNMRTMEKSNLKVIRQSNCFNEQGLLEHCRPTQ
jgi:hypothetical protein